MCDNVALKWASRRRRGLGKDRKRIEAFSLSLSQFLSTSMSLLCPWESSLSLLGLGRDRSHRLICERKRRQTHEGPDERFETIAHPHGAGSQSAKALSVAASPCVERVNRRFYQTHRPYQEKRADRDV